MIHSVTSGKIDLISGVFGLTGIAIRTRGPGTFEFDAKSCTYHVSGAYAGEAWYFALSRRRIGFDVVDLCKVPSSLSDLRPLMAPVFTTNALSRAGASAHIVQLCAAEALGKFLGVGLNREILQTPMLCPRENSFDLIEKIEIEGRRVALLDVSSLIQSNGSARFLGILAL